jgi:hypothetical protein
MTTATAGKPDGKKLFKDHEPEIVACIPVFSTHLDGYTIVPACVLTGWFLLAGTSLLARSFATTCQCGSFSACSMQRPFVLVYRSFGEK